MFGRVHHVGFVVVQLDAAERHFLSLGYTRRADPVHDDYQRADLLFLVRQGADRAEPLVELIHPSEENSKTYAFTTRNEFQIHHLCFETSDIAAATAQARKDGFVLVQPIVPAPAIGGSPIAFLYGRPIGLFELVESPPF